MCRTQMRYLFILLVIAIPYHCWSQKIDTTIQRNGEIYQKVITEYNNGIPIKKTYKTEGDEKLSKEEMFMRGHHGHHHGHHHEQYFPDMDSIKEYNDNGLIRYENIFGKSPYEKHYYYDSNWNLTNTVLIEGKNNLYSCGQLHIGVNVDEVAMEGKLQAKLKKTFLITNRGNRNEELFFQCKVSSISILPPTIKINAGETAEVQVISKNTDYHLKSAISITDKTAKLCELPIRITRYDLDGTDFHSDAKTAKKQPILCFKKETISLKLITNEKLMFIHNGKNIVQNQPISKKITPISLSDLKPGKYLLEIRNLGTNESRFCQIEKK